VNRKNEIFEKFSSGKWKILTGFFQNQKKNIAIVLVVCLIAYLVATIASSFVVGVFMDHMDESQKMMARRSSNNSSKSSFRGDRFNYVTMRRKVIGRNLFNSSGEYPEEKKLDQDEVEERKEFDPYAKCQKSRLNVKLLGTIYMGNPEKSMATIKETGYDIADIYKTGDSIIGHDEAQVVAVVRNKVVINNNGIKECIEFEQKNNRATKSYQPTDSNEDFEHLDSGQNSETTGGCVILEGGYVESELGEGFSKIITAARLVPNMENNSVSGFKMFAINQSSLLGKIGFKNGDIVTQVNDTSLKLPEHGFALYEAFQDERDISIYVLRGGKTPKTLCVKIK
jgi:type II secretion system protein C